eukprot:scaffold78948_cov30-Tisochrysis_lutea.AAC.1
MGTCATLPSGLCHTRSTHSPIASSWSSSKPAHKTPSGAQPGSSSAWRRNLPRSSPSGGGRPSRLSKSPERGGRARGSCGGQKTGRWMATGEKADAETSAQ